MYTCRAFEVPVVSQDYTGTTLLPWLGQIVIANPCLQYRSSETRVVADIMVIRWVYD